MKKYLAIALILISTSQVLAQQDPQYTQYMYNTISINPAYAGSRGALSIAGLYRTQWVGLDGAPETGTFNIHSPIGDGRIGLGFSLVNDRIGEGTVEDTYFDVAVSYTIPVSETAKFSFGIKGGGHLLNVDFTKLSQYTPELTAMNNVENKFSPNIGLGLYYHTNKWYVGLSAPNILETEFYDNQQVQAASGSTVFVATKRINYYLIGGYVFDIDKEWKLKPTVLAKAVDGAPLQVDLSANFLFKNKLTLGAAYRWDAAFSALAGFQISEQLMLGLAYDREVTELGSTQFNNGSYEVFLRFELVKNFKKLINPRFF
ncbi:type IX secretion system membrane protein PorP/SprF [Flavobacteriaceae bacterium MHTCC 0001]